MAAADDDDEDDDDDVVCVCVCVAEFPPLYTNTTSSLAFLSLFWHFFSSFDLVLTII